MIIKKFTGKTESDALEAARKELGSGVVTMNVKTVKGKGFFAWLFGIKQAEVTVALEEEGDVLRGRASGDGALQVLGTQGPEGDSVLRQKKLSGQGASAGGGLSMEGRISTEGGLSAEDKLSIEKRLDSLQNLLVSRFQKSEEERREISETGGSSEEKEELPEEKEEITEQERFIRLLYNTMLESEVDEKYANQIVDDVDGTAKSNLPIDHILSNVYQKMILKFGRAEGILPAEKTPKIVLFMGPTGVGKTTTIAKIASNYSVEEKQRVALLTADTYRIAAVEQLRTYANILEVPFRVIYSEEEARSAIRDFREYDYVFVDTAGHSHQNEEQLERMKRLFEVMNEEGECQTFLVLSATTKYHDLLKIVSSYKEIADFQMIFTKLDETATWGNLLNLKLFTDTPIAFVTYGQNVPNDIEQFNPQKTVKQILSTKTV